MTSIPRNERQERIEGLRAILNLFEQNPDLPMPSRFFGHSVFGHDAEAFAELDAIAATLRAAGFDVKDETSDEKREVRIDIGCTYFYARYHLDAAEDRLLAQMSYTDNVQFDAEAVAAR